MTTAEPERDPVLPEQTRDDLDVGWGDDGGWGRAEDEHPDDDERILRERPPHWQ